MTLAETMFAMIESDMIVNGTVRGISYDWSVVHCGNWSLYVSYCEEPSELVYTRTVGDALTGPEVTDLALRVVDGIYNRP